MKILRQNGNITKRQMANLAVNGGMSVTELEDGAHLNPYNYVQYEDTNSNGEVVTILAVFDGAYDKPVTTTSPTFIENFFKFSDIMEGEQYELVKITGTANRSGRTYVNCALSE